MLKRCANCGSAQSRCVDCVLVVNCTYRKVSHPFVDGAGQHSRLAKNADRVRG